LAIAAAVTASAPRAAMSDVDPLRPIEPGELRPVHRPRPAPLVGGAILFGVSYGLTLYEFPLGGALVPVAGPLLVGHNSSSMLARQIALGTAQLVGLTLLGVGIQGETVLAPARPRRPRHQSWTLAPALAPRLQGLVLAGSF
jgi:hypothetical protein